MINKYYFFKKRLLVIFLFWGLISSGLTGILIFSSENVIAGPGQNLIITTNYIVTENEIWNNITVKASGKLIVPTSSSLNANNIFLEGESIVEISGGYILLNTATHAGNVGFNGTCTYFNVTNGAILNIFGANGWADTSSGGPYDVFIPIGKGGDATLNITASKGININNSMINIIGGNGFDLPPSNTTVCNAWTIGTLSGYAAAGGNATVSLNLTNTNTTLVIDHSTIYATGGYGGNAANGGNASSVDPGKGGGYSNGGLVNGYVGSGGNATIRIYANCPITIIDSNIRSLGGTGGSGGNGGIGGSTGDSLFCGGGGGGGYGGGNGGGGSNNSGDSIVDEYVGSGGSGSIFIFSNSIVSIISSELFTIGGYGGDSGNGGAAGNSGGGSHGGAGGGGGGGYGGGGGGKGGHYHGGCTLVGGFVGSGNCANIVIKGYSIIIKNSNIKSIGGMGGNAGNGATGSIGNAAGGPGGGGYGGGGGSGGYGYNDGGNGGSCTIMEYVGFGGNSSIKIYSVYSLRMNDTQIYGFAGNGGNTGNGGNAAASAGGGGGYGGGGGAPYPGAGGQFGGNASIYGYVGSGGTAKINISTFLLIIHNCIINSSAGDGGSGSLGGTGSGTHGGGGGGYGGGGGGCDDLGGIGIVDPTVGKAGDTSLLINALKPSITIANNITSNSGFGGSLNHPGGSGVYGGYGGGTGGVVQGTSSAFIPMSRPLLKFPINNSKNVSFSPTLEWFAVYNSTTNGPATSYLLQLDDDNNWVDSNIIDIDVGSVTSYPTPLLSAKILYYWRVKANYNVNNAGWSEVWNFKINNFPPILKNKFEDFSMFEDTIDNTTVNLNFIFEDPNSDELFFNYSGNENISIKIYTNGIVEFKPLPNWTGYEDIMFSANDSYNHNKQDPYDVIRVTVLNVNDAPTINTTDIVATNEDEYYEVVYTATEIDIGDILIWSYESNAAWLHWGIFNHTLFGTPLNDNVGSYWVRINVSDGNGGYDEHHFNLTVININDRPEIITPDRSIANLSELYEVDYNAIDIDSLLSKQTWFLETNASWLNIDSTTGVLSGTPMFNDLGWFNVNITVDDGDGGSDWHEFILTVEKGNEPPEITTIDKVSITAGASYNVIYEATDDRTPLSSLIWSYNSNASWLSFNKITRTLSGNPTLSHVGWYWVNITVNDDEGGFDSHNFTLTVWASANQPPDILTEDDINAVVGELYSVDYEADDDRTPLDKLQWSLETNASDWLGINPVTGVLSGTPELKDVGSYWVKVSVYDGEDGWDFTNFTLWVTTEPITSFKPELSNPSMTPISGDTETLFTFSVDYSHPKGDLPDSIQVVIDGNANNMESTNGHYECHTKLSEGNHTYYFTTTLGNFVVNTDEYQTGYIDKSTDVEPDDGDGDEDNTMLYAGIGIVVIIIIVVLILLFIFLKKKGEEEEAPAVEAPPPTPDEMPPEAPILEQPPQPVVQQEPISVPEQPPTPEAPPQQVPIPETPPPPEVTPQVPQVEPAPEPAPIPQVEEQPQPTPQVEAQSQVEVQEPQGQAPVPKIKDPQE